MRVDEVEQDLDEYEFHTVRHPTDDIEIQVLHRGRVVGFLVAWSYGRILEDDLPGTKYVSENYLHVGEVKLQKKHQGQGLGLMMYRVLLQDLPVKWKGICSYLGRRGNDKQVPRIWARLGGRLYPESRFMVVDRAS